MKGITTFFSLDCKNTTQDDTKFNRKANIFNWICLKMCGRRFSFFYDYPFFIISNAKRNFGV